MWQLSKISHEDFHCLELSRSYQITTVLVMIKENVIISIALFVVKCYNVDKSYA